MNSTHTYINKHLGLVITVPAVVLGLLLFAGSAYAQSATTTPGTPSTGGYAPLTESVLALSATVAGAGLVYLYRSRPEAIEQA